MIVYILLATIENNFCFSESLGFIFLEWCLVLFFALPFFPKRFKGVKGYFKALWKSLLTIVGV